MENTLTTADFLALEGRGGYYDRGHHSCKGMSATGIGLAAGLGGGALLLAIAGIWGVNQASKARAKGAEQMNNAVCGNLNQLATLALAERSSRETWQNQHAPTMVQYTNATAQSGAGAGATSSALATAEALALLNQQNGGLNSAIGGCNFLRVAKFAAPKNCGCGCGCDD